jgi:hypothetical protein
VLQGDKKERNSVHTVNRRKGNWIGHILSRNCFLKLVIEGNIQAKIEVTGKRGRRCKQLLDNLKENKGYWILKEDVLRRILWGSGFGSGCGPVVRPRYELMNELYLNHQGNDTA